MKRIICIILFVCLFPINVFAVEVWPGVVGHGTTGWQMNDAPGTGDPKIYIIDTIDFAAASGSYTSDYKGDSSNVPAYVGNIRYVMESAANEDGSGNPNGKYLLTEISGEAFNTTGSFILYMEDNDWTIVDFDPPGLSGGGLNFGNIKFSALSSNRTLTHFFMTGFRCMHGGGANGVDGGSIDTAPGDANRKCIAFNATVAGDDISYIGFHQNTLIWSPDGPISISGEPDIIDASKITFSKNIVGQTIAYGKSEDWTDGNTYAKWEIVEHSAHEGYFECIVANTGDTGVNEPEADGNAWWRELDADITNRNLTSWMGLTTDQVDEISVVGNLFTHTNQRGPFTSNFGAFNIDGNIHYNSEVYTANVNSATKPSLNDWMKGTFIGNIAIGGPDSIPATDEQYPILFVKSDPTKGWYGTVVETGSADSGSGTTLTDSSESWGDLSSYVIKLTSGTGEDPAYIDISSNTGSIITVSSWGGSNPGSGTVYEVLDFSNHDLYIAKNKMIECDSEPCASNYTVRLQSTEAPDSLTNDYDWDYVNNVEDIPESHVKHSTEPTGAHVSGYTPMAVAVVESTLLAADADGVGAYPANRDTVTSAIITEVTNRTSSGFLTSVEKTVDYPTISAGSVTLDIPEDPFSLCDDDYRRIDHWLYNGDLDGCYTSSIGGYNSNAPTIKYNSNAPVVSTQ